MAEERPVRHQTQGDGSRKQWKNCAAATGGNAVLRARKNVNPKRGYPWATLSLPTMSSAIRDWCDRHFNTSAVEGLRQDWVNAALRAMYGVSMGYAYLISWVKVVAFILDHRGISVSVIYAYFLGTAYAGSATFTGRHRIFINERRWNSTKQRHEFLVYDPLCDGRRASIPKGPQWVPVALVRKAMEAAGIEVSYTPATA